MVEAGDPSYDDLLPDAPLVKKKPVSVAPPAPLMPRKLMATAPGKPVPGRPGRAGNPRETEDAPQKVLVPESSLEAAQHAIEAMTDPDELISDA